MAFCLRARVVNVGGIFSRISPLPHGSFLANKHTYTRALRDGDMRCEMMMREHSEGSYAQAGDKDNELHIHAASYLLGCHVGSTLSVDWT